MYVKQSEERHGVVVAIQVRSIRMGTRVAPSQHYSFLVICFDDSWKIWTACIQG